MAFNPLANFNQGYGGGMAIRQDREKAEAMQMQQQEEMRLRKQRESAINAGAKSAAMRQTMVDQPDFAFKAMQHLKTDERGLDALIEDSAMLLHQVEMDPSGTSAMALLQDRKANIPQGRNSFQTDNAINILETQGPEALYKNLSSFMDLPNQIKGSSSNYAPQISPVQTDPDTGQKYVIKTDRNTKETTRVDVEGAMGESVPAEEQRLIRRELLKDAAAESKGAFTSLKTVKQSLGTIDEAIAAIDKGASSGVGERYFPSFKQATIELENAANRMGLDVVSATTFGALSEGELRLAMDTAMPSNLQPQDLRKWLVERKKAKQKLGRELNKMAIALGKGKMTIAEYLEKNATFGEPQAEDVENQTVNPQSEDAKAEAWARANPNDPRAAAILKKQGKS